MEELRAEIQAESVGDSECEADETLLQGSLIGDEGERNEDISGGSEHHSATEKVQLQHVVW